MSNQLIIEGDYKQNFSNLIDNEKFKNVLIITSNGNQKRGFWSRYHSICEINIWKNDWPNFL